MCRDLLALDVADRGVVVEVDDDWVPHLRFGNDENGRAPAGDAVLEATVTCGLGAEGNVAPGTINRLVLEGPSAAQLADAVVLVDNPVPASAGWTRRRSGRCATVRPSRDFEPQRCVTAEDYATRASRYPGVERAFARVEWTGAWETVVLAVDRVGGVPVDLDVRGGARRLPRGVPRHGPRPGGRANPATCRSPSPSGCARSPGTDWPTVRAAVGELLSSRVSPRAGAGLVPSRTG